MQYSITVTILFHHYHFMQNITMLKTDRRNITGAKCYRTTGYPRHKAVYRSAMWNL